MKLVVLALCFMLSAASAKGLGDYAAEYVMRTAVGLTVQYSKPIGKGCKKAFHKVIRRKQAAVQKIS
jgi:hypothetical protein